MASGFAALVGSGAENNPETVVEVRNVGEADFIDGWNSMRFRIRSGQRALVPVDAALLWFGDWRARDTAEDKPRSREVNRLRVRTGVYHESPIPTRDMEVYTVDGARITTIAEDPEGTNFPELVHSGNMEMEALERELAAQKKRMAILERLLLERRQDEEEGVDEVPEDMAGIEEGPGPVDPSGPGSGSGSGRTTPVLKPPARPGVAKARIQPIQRRRGPVMPDADQG